MVIVINMKAFTPENNQLTFEDSLALVQDRIAKMVYNQLNILAPKVNLTYNNLTQNYVINSFYRNSSKPNQGTCSELREGLFQELIQDRDELYPEFKTIIRCDGKDGENGYFNKPQSIHCFLLVSREENILFKGDNLIVNKGDEIEFFVDGLDQFYLIDPSFGKIIPFADSGYTIDKIHGEKVVISQSNYLSLPNRAAVPLTFDKDKKLWLLYNGGNKEGLCLAQNGNEINGFGGIAKYPLASKKIEYRFIGDNIMLSVLKSLRAKVASQIIDNRTEGQKISDVIDLISKDTEGGFAKFSESNPELHASLMGFLNQQSLKI
jgi:hypothetical protein